ncbi:LCP family protein [Modestobacter sp. VKM Ac-2979]|uniref:LCP family protein n=1 Tax=unclassified Modestobacter TaxID=2643866 RepID=UPI0022AB80E7|nr:MULTISPECIES: LCP family protein [unclassified Modestobacter]MCZ2811416.1 LCP family protein [Modestobacter sp. VKM Ac-2979]MCZ2840929.1 LCP family protein [Modestobacter sp. VKM Ac-2980]
MPLRPVPRAAHGAAPAPPPAAAPPTPQPPAAVPPPPRPVHPPSVTPSAPPQYSVPVPGVRRSLPVPPIPGRDVPVVPGGATVADLPAPRPPAGPVRRRLTRVAFALVALLGLVAVFYVGLYFYVDRGIDRVDALVTDGPEVLAPQLQETSSTYLLVGTGVPGRSGLPGVSPVVVHVSGDGEQAVLVSLPPTALTDTPVCRTADGELRQPVTEPFAAALLDGGPSCLVRSVQQLTGLRVDHYVSVDLARLPGMVEALGGVPVCPGTGGLQLAGAEVTGYLQPAATGTDVTGAAVAEREQRVLVSALDSALADSTLVDPLTLTRFLSRAGDAFTVDAGTTLGDLRSFGATLGELSGSAIERTGLPVAEVGHVPNGSDQAVVVVDATATRQLFDSVIDAGRLPAPAAEDVADAAPTDPALTEPAAGDPVPEGTTVSVAPAGVTVDVLDGSGAGRTGEVADGLAAAGFRVGARGIEPATVDRTVVRYGPAALEPARTVAAAVPGAVLVETDLVGSAVQLVVGPAYTGLAPVDIGTPVPTTAAPDPAVAEAEAASSCS